MSTPTRSRPRRRKQYLNHLRYEVQVLTGYGWGSAGNFPARDLTEGRKSLDLCAKGAMGNGDVHDHRLVRLTPVVIAVRKATLRFNQKKQCYEPVKRKRA